METKMVDRTLEKIELARQIGLRDYVSTREQAEKDARTIQEITLTKFKPYKTREEFVKRCKFMRKMVFHSHDEYSEIGGIIGMFLGVFICYFVHSNFFNITEESRVLFLLLYSVVGLIIGMTVGSYRKCDIARMNLNNWTDELPYGALLATKEAHEQGIRLFEIYYPVKNRVRLIADPIIVGYKNGIMVEVFAWDDSKIYE